MMEVYRGGANTWECDEMGHMNVRFYVARMMEGLSALAPAAAMPRAFLAGAASTLRPRDQHIRFLREAHAGRPFHMTACTLDVRDSSVLIYQQLTHASGEPCAAFRTWVDHVDVETGAPFAWSNRARDALEGLRDEPPADLAPRSLDPASESLANAHAVEADRIGAPVIGLGAIPTQHCDVFGCMAPEFFIARISDSVGNILGPWRQEVAAWARTEGVERIGSAVLEYRLVYRRWPRAGDRFVIRSSVGARHGKAHAIVHWILDPATGDAWCTSEAVSVIFDLDRRKSLSPPAELAGRMVKTAPAGLRI